MRMSSFASAALVLCLSASAASAQTTATGSLVNNTSFAIHQIFLSPSDNRYWGPDQLGNQILEPGFAFTLSGIPCNTYDLKIVDEDGDECIIEGGYMCGDEGQWILTDEELLGCQGYQTSTASATLVNQTSFDIHALFISPSTADQWGPDQLGNRILETGFSFTFSGLPCGVYDVKLIDEDGDACVIGGVHLCGAEGESVITDRELLSCQGW